MTRQGQGLIEMEDGEVYEGTWKNNKRATGKVTNFRDVQGNLFSGQVEYYPADQSFDKFVGTVTATNGKTYDL